MTEDSDAGVKTDIRTIVLATIWQAIKDYEKPGTRKSARRDAEAFLFGSRIKMYYEILRKMGVNVDVLKKLDFLIHQAKMNRNEQMIQVTLKLETQEIQLLPPQE